MKLYLNLFTFAWALSLMGCGAKPISEIDQREIKLALNWFPEAEHGGYFAAEVEGHFKEHKLSVEIQSGGPDAPVIQKVATGQVHYGIANADDVLNGRAAGAPIVAVFAPIDINPRCIMAHSSANLQSVGDIKNMTLAMSARPSFSHWLKSNYAFEGVSIVPYPASIAVFLNDPNFAQQAYNISEPFLAEKKGAQTKIFMVSDLGFNPYCSVLITTESRIREHPKEVKSMVEASGLGWRDYFNRPEASNAYIHAKNSEMPLDVLAFGAEQLKSMSLYQESSFGQMTTDRWLSLAQQMKDCDLIELSAQDVNKAWVNFKEL